MTKIKSAKDVYDTVKGEFLGKDVEHCYVLTLGSSNNVIALHWVAFGSENACVVPKKVIARHAIQDLATGVVLIHNHPSGNVQPSSSDMKETESLREMLKILDTALLDHVIVGGESYFSFAEEKEFKVK